MDLSLPPIPLSLIKGLTPPAKNDPQNLAEMKAAARDYEAVFLTQMIKPMLETIPVDETFGGGHAEEVYRGLMADEYGKIMAASGGIGLASHITDALIKAQEAASKGQ